MNVVVCPSKLLFHLPCPGCGVTRATMLFLRGHIVEALSLNLNVIFSIGFICIFPILLCCDMIMRKTITHQVWCKIDSVLKIKWVFFLFCIFELYIWIHNIIFHIQFELEEANVPICNIPENGESQKYLMEFPYRHQTIARPYLHHIQTIRNKLSSDSSTFSCSLYDIIY